jgi:hypothetical protein
MISEETKGIIEKAFVGETAIGRHCPRLTNFRTVAATIRTSEIQASEAEGDCAPKAETPIYWYRWMSYGRL